MLTVKQAKLNIIQAKQGAIEAPHRAAHLKDVIFLFSIKAA